jgi:hypothetical protein
MSKRFDNRKLLIILAGLIVLLLLTVIVRIPRERSTLKGTLVEFDTASVGGIEITPKSGSSEPFSFRRYNDKWDIVRGVIVAVPIQGAVKNIMSEILAIKPRSLAAVGESKWKEYELTDSLATRVKITNSKGKELAGLLIGRFSYRQTGDPYGGYGGNNIEGTTYVRLDGEKEIYAVDGFLAFTFSGGFNDWRDKTFVRCNSDDITKITFTLPADSSYILMKRDSLWFAANQKTDSAKTANYLNSISLVDGQEFADGYKPASFPSYQIVIEGNNLLNITVKCFKGEGDSLILNSSLNPEVYYITRREGIFAELFKPLNHFF